MKTAWLVSFNCILLFLCCCCFFALFFFIDIHITRKGNKELKEILYQTGTHHIHIHINWIEISWLDHFFISPLSSALNIFYGKRRNENFFFCFPEREKKGEQFIWTKDQVKWWWSASNIVNTSSRFIFLAISFFERKFLHPFLCQGKKERARRKEAGSNEHLSYIFPFLFFWWRKKWGVKIVAKIFNLLSIVLPRFEMVE